MDKILQKLNLVHDKNNVVSNLTKNPPKEPKNVMPTTYAPRKFAVEQADTLFLPTDRGYKYLLVVVDVATRTTDAEPMKSKDSTTVTKALLKIFKRHIIEPPKRFEIDDGSEFKGSFKDYFQQLFKIVTKVAGRHRQQSVVETKNFQIGKILNTNMLVEEVNNGETSRSWVELIPKVIKLMNEHLAHPPKEVTVDTPIKTNKFSEDILPVGTKVRIQLDNPKSYIDEKRLHGKFRAGDVRWTKKIGTVTEFYLRPGQPVMYCVDDDKRVAYTKYQLQVVKDEVMPPTTGQTRWIIDKLIKKVKVKNKWYFDVRWSDKSITREPRSNLIKDVPQLVEDFETKGKKK